MTNSIPRINQSILVSICLPLRFRIATLLDVEESSIPHPEISDHRRILACAQLIEQGLEKLPFHSYHTLESMFKVFGEHGIDRRNPYYQAVFERIRALNQNPPELYRGLGKPGKILGEHRLGGGMLIRAACLARAGLVIEIE